MDTYGTTKSKPVWLSAMLLSSPMGVLMGYGMTAQLHNWRLSFFLQGMIVCSMSALMLLVPKHYVNINEALEAKQTEKERRKTVPEMGGTG